MTGEIKTIALLGHPNDKRATRALAQALRPMLDLESFDIWQRGEDENAFESLPAQIEKKLELAWTVIVVLGTEGNIEDAIGGPEKTAILQRIAEAKGDFGRLLVQLPSSQEPPFYLKPWVKIDVAALTDLRSTAEDIVKRLKIKGRGQIEVAIDDALDALVRPSDQLVKNFTQIADLLEDGKPITILATPYVSADAVDDHSCPSKVRELLLALIRKNDERLYQALVDGRDAANVEPLLWQDHLATFCLMSGCSRDAVITAIDDAITAADDVDAKRYGAALEESKKDNKPVAPPKGVFNSIAAFARRMSNTDVPRSVALPGITIISVCTGLRIERALVAAGCSFERVTIVRNGQQREVNHVVFRPTEKNISRALAGNGRFLPDGEAPNASDKVDFIRLVKVLGSRDLDSGFLGSDLGQTYTLLFDIKDRLFKFVEAAGTGPYLMLGGGFATPPLQAAHEVLFRELLEKAERRPRIMIVPNSTVSVDPLRKIETDRIVRLVDATESGPGRLQVLSGDPANFIDALTIAFGGPGAAQPGGGG